MFKDWIELELVDGDGDPVLSKKYTPHLADSSTKEGKLDAKGRARIDGLPPGPVVTEYPDTVSPGDEQKYTNGNSGE